ncbi:hypothetical protein RI129_003053 [Pyrocoelia pectoralis]|uniref:Uncharacterized protein n=1 Tax=Pyrocoelia pectoralis TaxID=417401 RepID=A0AAN7VN67_9COLE
MDKFIVTLRKTKTRRDIHDWEEVQPSCSSNKLEPEVAEGSTCKNSSNSSTTPDEQLDNECSTRSSRISDSSLESELSEDASVEPEGSEMPKITVLLERVATSYKVILKCFIKKTVLDRYKNNIGALVVNDPSNFLELNKMYFGAELELYLSGNNTIIDKAELHSFKRRALDFYIELCIQIKSRFNFSSDVLHFASFFEPNLVISGDILSIAQAGLFFSGLDIDMEELNVEWNLASEVGKNFSDLDLQGFWASINEQKNSLG